MSSVFLTERLASLSSKLGTPSYASSNSSKSLLRLSTRLTMPSSRALRIASNLLLSSHHLLATNLLDAVPLSLLVGLQLVEQIFLRCPHLAPWSQRQIFHQLAE